MEGIRHPFCLFFIAFLVALNGFSLQVETDSLLWAEPVPPIYLADTLCIHQADNAPLFVERVIANNSETIFGTPHLLVVNDFSARPLENAEDNEWFFLVFFVALFLVFIPLLYFPYYSGQFFRSVVHTIQFSKIKKEEYFDNKTPKWMLSANFLIVISLMVALTLPRFNVSSVLTDLDFIVRFGLAFALVSLLFLLKRGVEWFLSWVFEQKNVLEKHLEVTVFFNNLTGIIFLPIVVVYYYNSEAISIHFLWILPLLTFLLKIARRSMVWFKQSNLSLFYIFLYLCAVELAPLLLIIKIATTTLGF